MAKQGEDKIRLEVTPEFAAYAPGGQETCWVTSTIIAPFYEPTSRSEIDLVAVIDRSGSMSGTKIELVKETLAFVIDQLKEQDRFCLVSYASDVTVDIPLTHMTKEEKKSAKDVVKGLRATTSTALCDGLITGMQQIMTRIGDKAKVASVLLLTDGQANVGPSNMESILDAMKNPMAYGMQQSSSRHNVPNNRSRQRFNPFGLFRNASSQPSPKPVVQQQQGVSPPPALQQQQQQVLPPPPPPAPQQQQQQQVVPPPPPPAPQQQQQQLQQQSVPPPPPPVPQQQQGVLASTTEKVPFEGTIYTFGFGSDHDARLLEAISQAAEGAYYYIDSAEKIPESFADCLGGLLSVVGQNMEMSLTCTNGCTMANVHAKNPAKMSDGNTRCMVQLGDLQSEEERDVVLELTLPATGEEASDWMVVSARLTYFNVITSVMEDVQCDLKVQRKQEGVQVPNKSVLVQKIRISALRSLKEARELGGAGNLDKARDVIKAAIASIEKSELTDHNLVKYLLADMKDILESYSSQAAYVGFGSKKMANVYQSNMQQRSQTSGASAYETRSKVASKAAFRKI